MIRPNNKLFNKHKESADCSSSTADYRLNGVMTAERWGKTLITMIFQLMLDIWDQRNKDGHHLVYKNESQLSRQRILDMIIALQESQPEVRYCDRDFVFCPLETLEQYTLGNLLSWYKSACSIIQAQKQYVNRQRSIRDIFPVMQTATDSSTSPTPIPTSNSDPNRIR